MKRFGWALLASAFVMAGCHQDMYEQPRLNTLSKSDFFADGSAARMPVEGTVARDDYNPDKLFTEGLENGELATRFPSPVTKAMLERGRERYDVFCLPCHGKVGYGDGMIVARGYKQPRSFHIPELREMPPGYFYRTLIVGTEELTGRPFLPEDAKVVGKGDMVHPVLGKNMKPEDRWAIVAYIYALQKSQYTGVNELTPEDMAQLNQSDTNQEAQGGGH